MKYSKRLSMKDDDEDGGRELHSRAVWAFYQFFATTLIIISPWGWFQSRYREMPLRRASAFPLFFVAGYNPSLL
jgi:hypothetical protein